MAESTSMIARPLGVVIPAAGAGLRLGGVAKALLRRDDATFLERILATARRASVADAVVVVGPPFAERVADAARDLGARVALNPEPRRGMASSVAVGFAALADGPANAAWLWPVDHPDIRGGTLAALADALGAHGVAKPRFAGRCGHPPLIARTLWPALATCADVEGGARAVLAKASGVIVDVDDPGVLDDVDAPPEAALAAPRADP